MWHPDIEDILEAHEQASFVSRIRTDGFHMSFKRGVGLLEDIIEEAQNKNSVFEAAAIYLKEIIAQHPFADGNHRTAFLVTLKFLRQNEETFVADKVFDTEEIVNVLKNEIKFMDNKRIAAWIKTGEIS